MAALEELLERSGANAAIIASRDGRPFAEKTRERIGVESGRLAAMASSLAALGDGVLRELSSGALDHVLIEGSGGKFVVCRIPGPITRSCSPCMPALRRASALCSDRRRPAP
jgi:predicted regulator of Ras-like GTPase activity (Roadblock/LC7/MglB family)